MFAALRISRGQCETSFGIVRDANRIGFLHRPFGVRNHVLDEIRVLNFK